MAKRKRTAPRAAPPPAPPPRPAPARRALAALRRYGFAIVFVVAVGGGVALGLAQGNKDDPQVGAGTTTTQQTQGAFRSNRERVAGLPPAEAFAETCGACHSLRAAHATGGVGPDLDRVHLTAALVRTRIETGSSDGVMPKNLLLGRQADQVARYVARVSRASRR